MHTSFTSHPASYRDPSGFLFFREGCLYRQVNQCFREDFDLFIQSGLYRHLTDQNMLVRHETVEENVTGAENWYQTLKPEFLPFISWPSEWCFDMLRDAALVTLAAAREALRYNMMLKDASAYNVQWHRGGMMFIDTLSFERYNEAKPWIAYRQFCEQFYAPLALMHYLQWPLPEIFLAYPEGIPVRLAKKILPFKSRFHLHTWLHVHLHGSAAAAKTARTAEKPFSRQKMNNLLRSLEEGIRSFALTGPTGVWSGYYDEASQREDYLVLKRSIISKWTHERHFGKVIDLGANEGAFSLLVREKADLVISADLDHFSINRLYSHLKKEGIQNIHPIILDFSQPTPATGVNNEERASFFKRAAGADLVLALALVHHLAIGKNIPFDQVAKGMSALGQQLIIEFVPKHDPKVRLMLSGKNDIYSSYEEQGFVKSFEKYFSLIKKEAVGSSGRTLYFFERHE